MRRQKDLIDDLFNGSLSEGDMVIYMKEIKGDNGAEMKFWCAVYEKLCEYIDSKGHHGEWVGSKKRIVFKEPQGLIMYTDPIFTLALRILQDIWGEDGNGDASQPKKKGNKPKEIRFDDIITAKDREHFKKILHKNIDGCKSGNLIGLTLLNANLRGLISKTPSRAQFEAEFGETVDMKMFSNIQTYMNKNKYERIALEHPIDWEQ